MPQTATTTRQAENRSELSTSITSAIDSEGDSMLIGEPQLILEDGAHWELKIEGASSNKTYRMVVKNRSDNS